MSLFAGRTVRFSTLQLRLAVSILRSNSSSLALRNRFVFLGSAAGAAATTINQRRHIQIFCSNTKQADSDDCKTSTEQQQQPQKKMENKNEKLSVNKEELRKRLTPMQYQVTQEAATERPFTGCYNKHYEKGMYQCIVCHQELFSSDTKYDAGCGWPAFNDVLDKGKVTLHRDASIPERIRTEVRCARCNAHMGHVFEDGPKPTRKRYCINSAAIEFISAEQLNSQGGVPAAPTVTTATPIAQQ